MPWPGRTPPPHRAVTFFRDGLRFDAYPFPVASVAREPWLPATEVAEVRLRRFPPEVVRTDGEVLFVPREDAPHLDLFARLHGIPRAHRDDVWGWLSEPFLDTESTPEGERNVLALLAASGFDAAEVAAIRAEVGPAIRRLNARAWEWVHLGHYDVLVALGFRDRLPRAARRALGRGGEDVARYRRLAAIANRGRLTADEAPTPADALQAALGEWVYALACPADERRLRAHDPGAWLAACAARQEALRARLAPVVAAYAAPERAYHDVTHLLQVVGLCRDLGGHVPEEERPALAAAAWLHDAVYDPTARDNEERSAALLRATLGDVLDAPRLALAERLVLLTKDHARAETAAERVLSDADLWILAEEPARYARYAAGVRAEYAHVDDAAFAAGRLAFLRGMERAIEARGGLYHFLHPMHEAQARANLAGERARLEGAPAPG